MCEYCGCQDIAAIAELTREHDAVVAEIATVRVCVREGDVAGAAAVARRIALILTPHTAVEEHGLFPHLAPEFPDHVAALERDHREIEAVLDRAAHGTPEDPQWSAELLAAMERLRDHILKEQDGLFPASLSILDEEAWASVKTARAMAGSALEPGQPGSGQPHAAHPHDHSATHQHA
ncbi:hemerythrin domain-containing protein [Pedococcus sp. NPDC057267]|uniref:hemerythrin domain-containing protein n=1 Tax=Pedococcus sp. NPDC057267 TaxID=3346077 RepID=UPI0036438B9E